MALVDATGLAAMISVADEDAQFDGIIPLATDAQMKFIMPGRGRLVGTCQLDPDDRTILKDLLDGKCDRAQLTSDVEILDEAETLVRRGYMVWKLRRR